MCIQHVWHRINWTREIVCLCEKQIDLSDDAFPHYLPQASINKNIDSTLSLHKVFLSFSLYHFVSVDAEPRVRRYVSLFEYLIDRKTESIHILRTSIQLYTYVWSPYSQHKNPMWAEKYIEFCYQAVLTPLAHLLTYKLGFGCCCCCVKMSCWEIACSSGFFFGNYNFLKIFLCLSRERKRRVQSTIKYFHSVSHTVNRATKNVQFKNR